MRYRKSIVKPGAVVKHFKRETVKDTDSMKYLYKIIDVAEDTTTKEKLVIYKALYPCYGNGVFARKLSEFMSEVDHEKYPDIKQKNRFELYR